MLLAANILTTVSRGSQGVLLQHLRLCRARAGPPRGRGKGSLQTLILCYMISYHTLDYSIFDYIISY